MLTPAQSEPILETKTEEHMAKAYCVKCRTTREMKNPKAITMKNGRPATQGVCPVCRHQDVQDREGISKQEHNIESRVQDLGFLVSSGLTKRPFVVRSVGTHHVIQLIRVRVAACHSG